MKLGIRSILGWAAFCAIVLITIHGVYRNHLFEQTFWSPAGLNLLAMVAVAYAVWSLVFLVFAPRWFAATTLAALLILVGAAVGPLALAAALFFLFSCLVTGTLLMAGDGGQDLFSGLLRLLLGVAVWMAVANLAAHFPVNYPAVYAALLLVPLAVKPGRTRACMAGCARAFAPLDLPHRTSYAFMALAGFPALCHLLVALDPETGADALSVHLMVPAWVAYQHLWPFAFQHVSWALMPLGADWCYTAAYLLGGEFAAHLLNFSFFAALAGLVYAGCRRHLGHSAAFLLAGLFAASPLVQLVTGSLFVENLWAALLVGAVFALDRFHSTAAPRFFYLAAALTGAGLATKLGTTAFLLPAAVFALWELARNRALAGRRLRTGVIALLVLVLLGAAPYAFAWVRTGNPVFPFMNHIFKSPWFDSAVPFVNSRWSKHVDLLSPYRVAFKTRDYLESHDGALGFQYLVLAALGLALFSRKWPYLGKLAFAIALAFCALTFKSQPYLRYLYPGLPLLTVGASAALGRLWTDCRPLYRAVFAFLLIVFPLNVYFLPSSGWSHPDFFANPFDPEAQARLVAQVAPERQIVQYLNAHHPGRPVAFFGTDTTAGLRAEAYVYGWHTERYEWQAWLSTSPADYGRLARSLNLELFVAPVGWTQSDANPAIRTYLADYTEPEFRVGAFELRKLKPQAAASLEREERAMPGCGAGMIDDRSPQVRYSGRWRTVAQFGEACGGTLTYAEAPDAQATLMFSGTSVTYVFTKAYARGVAEVSVDGVKRDVIDQFSRGIEWRSHVTYSGLAAGPHSITIRPLHQKAADSRAFDIDIDGFVVE
jgi:hypothetical protein